VLEVVVVVVVVDIFEIRGKTNDYFFFFPKKNKKNV
jgi:hypothetical protein